MIAALTFEGGMDGLAFQTLVKTLLRAIAPRTQQALDEAITQAFAQASFKYIWKIFGTGLPIAATVPRSTEKSYSEQNL